MVGVGVIAALIGSLPWWNLGARGSFMKCLGLLCIIIDGCKSGFTHKKNTKTHLIWSALAPKSSDIKMRKVAIVTTHILPMQADTLKANGGCDISFICAD